MTNRYSTASVNGLVLKRYSGFYYVQGPDGELLECKLRGRLQDDVILVGDRVEYRPTEKGKGIIERVLARDVQLKRPAIANVNQVLVVMSFEQPVPNLKLLDRLLILIENLNLNAAIVLNKCDLPGNEIVATIREYYHRIGYPIIVTSAATGKGLEELSDAMNGKITVIAGPSGVGKTSLLNLLVPGQELKTGQVSRKLGRGRHTTRHVQLFPLPFGGWVADTPGFTVVDNPPIKREELAPLFIEFAEPSAKCRFLDCLHSGEVDCGVKDAVRDGTILASRHQNYLTILGEIIEKERCYR
ncbi:MAG: ribosome small subunit-dependent GTPase A [Syntrophomonadaceae bacterium]|jgi:ribosome biogenesis GTPase|nr:ribosome small subunit-dependent GTPase A [Syntrophomonadaceae bacterium]